ncbi:MAG: isoprenylcysteine carboxylmethyltransferase family protein [Pseudomonadota bacterium]|nr:isoprenylcysteine carboxylmethyltransferase family protein [Pseudomonadota bacterium]
MANVEPVILPAVRLDLDLVEKVVVTAFWGFLCTRLIPGVFESGEYLNILLLLSEALVVFFVVLRRRATAISERSIDWFVGFAGTLVPLFALPPEGEPVVPIAFCAILMLGGFGLNMSAKLTLLRSFGVVAANRGIKIGGPYRLIRHPMYAGYMLTQLGFLLSGPNFWNACVYALAFGLQVVRILAEERMLNQDPAYRELSVRVRYRLAPFVF